MSTSRAFQTSCFHHERVSKIYRRRVTVPYPRALLSISGNTYGYCRINLLEKVALPRPPRIAMLFDYRTLYSGLYGMSLVSQKSICVTQSTESFTGAHSRMEMVGNDFSRQRGSQWISSILESTPGRSSPRSRIIHVAFALSMKEPAYLQEDRTCEDHRHEWKRKTAENDRSGHAFQGIVVQ